MNYANQKKIKIINFDYIAHKGNSENDKEKNEAFLKAIDWKHYEKALTDLSGNAFKLWFYLLKWQGKGYYEFSPTHLQQALNIGSKNTVRAAKDELIRFGYARETSENIIEFSPSGMFD